MTPIKTKEEIVDKIWDADGQLKMAIILNPDARKVYDAMDQYAEQQSCLFAEWIDDKTYNNILSRVRARASDYFNQWVYHPVGQDEPKYMTTAELYTLYKQIIKP